MTLQIVRDEAPVCRGGILLFGQTERPEFAPILADLKTIARRDASFKVREVRFLFDNGNAVSILRRESELPPLLMIFCQSYPGEFSAAHFDRVRALFPLAPMILLAGTLCEGEGRTGHIPPGVIRLYYYQWESFGRPQLDRFLAGKPGRFSFPATATWDDFYRDADASRNEPLSEAFEPERLEASDALLPFVRPNAERSESRPEIAPEICVVSPSDRAMERLLLDLARFKGCSARAFDWERLESEEIGDDLPDSGPTRFWIDSVTRDPADDFDRLTRLARRFPDAEIDLLVFAPRREDARRFESIPRLRLIAKPFSLAAFL